MWRAPGRVGRWDPARREERAPGLAFLIDHPDFGGAACLFVLRHGAAVGMDLRLGRLRHVQKVMDRQPLRHAAPLRPARERPRVMPGSSTLFRVHCPA